MVNQNEPGLPPDLEGRGMEEAASLQELSDLMGFEISTEFTLPFDAMKIMYSSYGRELAEIQYTGEKQSAVYRQSLGTDDNSGDYSTYHDTVEMTANGNNVTLKGNDGLYTLALWADGVYSYSLSLSAGISESGWKDCLNH